jgi:hypothetical protein
MHPGATVWYTLTDADVERVWKQRENSHFHGSPVKTGEMLPAEVVRCYTAWEKRFADTPSFPSPEAAHQDFSGFADLRVLLPGNDVLWAPSAMEDTSPIASMGRGHGVTSVPAPGMFTRAVPGGLLG